MPYPTISEAKKYHLRLQQDEAFYLQKAAECREKINRLYAKIEEHNGENLPSVTPEMNQDMVSENSGGPPADYSRLDRLGHRIPPNPTMGYDYLPAEIKTAWETYSLATLNKLYLVAVVEHAIRALPRFGNKDAARLASMAESTYKTKKGILKATSADDTSLILL